LQPEEARFAAIETRGRSLTRRDELKKLMGEARVRLRPERP
jgi:hypothetical protein